MRVESAEQGVRFEWDGEPSTILAVGLRGTREQNHERLRLLKEVVRGARHDGIGWTDLELRERRETEKGVPVLGAPVLLLWKGQFGTWEEAGVAFTVLCKAVGMDDDSVQLDVKM